MTRRAGGERGVALVLVLWLLVILGAVAAAVVGSTRSASQVVLNARARTVARYAAESGIVAATAVLHQRLATAYTPAQTALALSGVDRAFRDLKDVPLGGGSFSVAMTDLSGRLDLNQGDPRTLAGLFSQFISSSAALAVADALQDWRDADDLVLPQGAEESTYLRAGSRVVPRNGPLTQLEEFQRVMGVTETLARGVAPYITVTGGKYINVNAAPEPVLAALPGIGSAGARAIVSQRQGGTVFTSVAEVLGLLGPGAAPAMSQLAIGPGSLLLTSRGWVPGHPLTHEVQAAYALVGQRLVLQSWRERDL